MGGSPYSFGPGGYTLAGVLRGGSLPLSVTTADLQALGAGVSSHSVTVDLPAGARFAGLELGEGAAIAFVDGLNTTITASVSLGAGGATATVGPTLDALPVSGSGLAPGRLVGGQTATLTIDAGGATSAVMTGTAPLSGLTYGSGGTLDGLTILGLRDDATGPFSVLFAAPADALQVGQQISAATGGGITGDGTGSHLAIASGGVVGSSATLTITGGTALPFLGLTATTVHGTPAPDLNTCSAGAISATVLYTY